ncbi:TylF/MycF/NovP-related O-methyltransferase [Nannocystis pusilla]|uniref:TylF/MycF/NovP-related O-methyltransferase n=1 Tax=Nannocystis pusilla TaxID=889268 RepID=UPI003DA591FB
MTLFDRLRRLRDDRRWRQQYPDFEPGFRAIHDRARPYTMTSTERMYALYQAVRHVHRAGIGGAFVECGVWKGGSAMVAALTFQELGDRERDLFLYDTYEGMSEPTARDISFKDQAPLGQWDKIKGTDHKVFCANSLADATASLGSTGYPREHVHFVMGKVEDTIPNTLPHAIAILRLDTDWYESTRHELVHLYPRLARGGVLIVDDYGHWRGAREAVDGYFAEHGGAPLLHRIDYTGRIAVKP